MDLNKIFSEPLSIRLDVSEHYILHPGQKVVVKHYNGYTIEFVSPGLCKFVYRGGFGFDIVPIDLPNPDIYITLLEPPIKSSL